MGRLIPAGTGMSCYRDLKPQFAEEEEEAVLLPGHVSDQATVKPSVQSAVQTAGAKIADKKTETSSVNPHTN